MRYEFLPPYSPDLNPIEHAFSAIKAWVRRNGAEVCAAMAEDDDSEVYLLLMRAVFSVTGESAKGWFSHCGYA